MYRCIECGEYYEITPDRMLCSRCSDKQVLGEPLRGILEVVLAKKIPEDWNVFDFLPVEPHFFPSIPVGNTPLWQGGRLREDTGFSELYFKDDGANPTGSLKDRASYLVAAFAKKFGIRDIVVASTGNAGSSMSGIGASAGLNVRLYLPSNVPEAKLIQSLQYGAKLIQVDGNYDAAYDQSMDYVAKHGGLSRNTAYNPLTIEGKKTVSLEIFKQLGNRIPDYVFVSVGDGVILSGLYRGFEDLLSQGKASRVPTIMGVQAEGSSAIFRAYQKGSFEVATSANTIADSISVDVPRGGDFALRKLKAHKGEMLTVSDEEILQAQTRIARSIGLFAEPAAAAAAAGFFKNLDKISKKAVCVILQTGNGLKDIASARKGVMG